MENKGVSIILAIKDDLFHLINFVNNFSRINAQKLELIVVDITNVDRSLRKNICNRSRIRYFNISSCLINKNISNYRGYQINFGVKYSNYELIFIPDADMHFTKKNLIELQKLSKRYDALYIPETIPSFNLIGKIRNFERSFYDASPIDAIRFFKKACFFKVKGFDYKFIKFGPDDWDFTLSLKKFNYKFGLARNHIVHQEYWKNIFDYILKKTSYSNTFNEYKSKWKNDHYSKKQFSILYRFFFVFIENGKWKKLIINLDLYFLFLIIKFYLSIHYLFKSFYYKK